MSRVGKGAAYLNYRHAFESARNRRTGGDSIRCRKTLPGDGETNDRASLLRSATRWTVRPRVSYA